jgi:hypothetical protein
MAKTKPKPTKRKTRKPTTTAIVKTEQTPAPTVVSGGRIRKLGQDEIALLKRTVAKGTSDDEFAMFLWVCRNHQVDPVVGEVYCIMRWDSKRDVVGQDENNRPIYQGGMKMTIQMGIGGLRGLAARKHKDYGSTDDPVWTFGERKTPAGKKIPDSVSVAVWKKGAERPTKATIFWDEFAPRTLQTEPFKHDFWNHSPANQLAKCCEAQALRKSYPDLNNIYIPEEMARRDEDYTPGGRQITDAEGFAPSGRAVTYAAQAKGQIEAEVERQKTGAPPSSQSEMRQPATQPPKAQIPNEPIDVKPEQVSKGIVEIDETDEAHPIIRGALAEILPQLQERCKTMKWENEWWRIEPRDVENAKAVCVYLGYRVLEILPKPEPKKPAAKEAVAPKATQPAGKREANTPAEPTVVTGIIEQAATESGKSPRVSVLLKVDRVKHWMSAFDTALFGFLIGGKGQEAELFVTKTVKGDKTYMNIVGLKRVGSKHFDDDGKTPVVQRSQQEAGAKTLWG